VDLALASPETLLILLAAGFVAGLVDAVAGGGGLIALPALLTAGVPPHVALGTNKLAGTFGTLSASRAFVRRGLFHPRRWRPVIAATFTGALAGTLSAWLVSADALARLLPLAVLAAALYVLLHRPAPAPAYGPEKAPPRGRGLALGGALGYWDGLVGPGTGAFWVSGAMALFRLDILHASGVARFMNLVSNVVSLATFAALGLVDWALGLFMGAALMAGAWIGAHTAIRWGGAFIRPVFVTLVLVMAGRLAWLEWVAAS
jgi:hypothetical protein